MESAGLAIGIAGLAGAFTACVDCFEYVQLGRHFGQDYGRCLLKLDTARLRMSRWGMAMGLGPQANVKQEITVSGEELRLVQSLLEQILGSFEDAERVSERFKKHTSVQSAGSDDLRVYNANSDLDPEYRRLHLTMRELAAQRQDRTSVRKKAAWALYEKKRFERLIDDLVGFTSQLIDLFPAVQNDQKALCKTEVSAISGTQNLMLLSNVAYRGDDILLDKITRELSSRGHIVTDWKADGSSKMWAGDENAFGIESKGHNFARFTVSDYADVHLGNMNRGK
ncbi:MAG: hypothetical protein Q9181_004255 [Wetmoreana brouardii]